MTKSNWRKKELILHTLPNHNLSSEKVRTGTQAGLNWDVEADAEVMEESCLLTCLPVACSAYFHIESMTISPGMVPVSMGWASPPSITKKSAPWQISWKHFLIWSSLLPVDSSLCCLNIKLASTKMEIFRDMRSVVSRFLWLSNTSLFPWLSTY